MLNKKKVLGRGLGALISGGGETAGPTDRTGDRFFMCPIGEIFPGTTQPRKRFEDSALRELSDSIREKGVIEPLIVRKNSLGYELIAGERRLRAARMADLKEVPVVVMEATDEESLEFAIIENIQREDLNTMEVAEAYKSLMDFGLSQDDVARKVGKERATVANYLRLLKLPPEIKDEIVKGSITMGHARALLSVDGHSAQVELCRRILSKGLSVRETETLASTWGREKGKAGKKQKPSPSSPLEDELRTIFGTRIAVKDRGGRGSIEISYYSAEERERIIELLKSVQG